MRLVITKVDDPVTAGVVYQEMFPGTGDVPARSIFLRTPVTVAANWPEDKLRHFQDRFAAMQTIAEIKPDSNY
jgi:hypothetical protein